MAENEVNVKNLLPLAKYLLILVESYPEPIRANILAEKTGHSKAAISKIRDRLMHICDSEHMVFEKGFVLSQSFNFIPSIFIVLLAHGNHKKFLSSRFFKTFISSERIHNKIVSLFPPYGERFSKEETSFLIQKVVESIEKLPSSDFEFLLKILSSRKQLTLSDLSGLENFKKIRNKIKFSFDSKEEFLKTIILRDKFFFLIRDILWAKMEDMSILKSLDENIKKEYKNIYKTTIDYYLRNIFSGFNESLIEAGKKYAKKDVANLLKIGSSHFLER